MDKLRSEAHLAKTFAVTVNGQERRVGSSFYRGDAANYYPRRTNMRTPEAISEWILKGWMPEQPFIDRSANIVAFGSCFAANIGRYLSSIGYDVSTQREGSTYIQRISDGLVNVHAICQQFEWAWENRVPSVELWHGWKAEEFGYDEQVRLETRKLFDAADVFILTFGLSEIWYDEPTGEVFWRAVPADKFDASRHKFRVATIEETMERLRRIHALIRTHRPQAKIVFTLSPIPLTATFRPVSCMTASTASKALLRAAIDQLHREVHPNDPDFFYFPAYEVVMLGFREPFNEGLRHPAAHVLNCNMKAFERYFCTTGLTDADLQAVMADALELDELLVVANDEERDALLLDRERGVEGQAFEDQGRREADDRQGARGDRPGEAAGARSRACRQARGARRVAKGAGSGARRFAQPGPIVAE